MGDNIDHDKDEVSVGKPMKYGELIDEISRHCDVRIDVVREVMDAFVDVAVEQIVNNGKFTVPRLFRVKRFLHSGSDSQALGLKEVPERYRLSVSLSGTLRNIAKRAQDYPDLVIDRNNWRDYWKNTSQFKKRSTSRNDESNQDELFEAFLGEDDEDFENDR